MVDLKRTPAALALAAALLFGLSAPATKALVALTDPWLLAGLLYLGSGLGLGLYRVAERLFGRARREASISPRDAVWLGAAILSGGVIGPILMLFGLARGSAAQTALLLNLEGVFTALLAWLAFGEAFARRIAVGMAAIALGAAALVWDPAARLAFDPAAALVSAACLAWAADNNLTRRISGGDPVAIAAWKGAIAGPVGILIGLGRGVELPGGTVLLSAGLVGLLGYGTSLVLFILALRHLGAARTGAYFSTAPFIGAIVGVGVLGEPVTPQLVAAATLMAAGVWLHLSERHEHEHMHEPLRHDHLHDHDVHHGHEHPGQILVQEPHAHPHVHGPLRHSHPHYPDLHHRHRH
jgi:drug/metabolite transporter (DMT)-like permease